MANWNNWVNSWRRWGSKPCGYAGQGNSRYKGLKELCTTNSEESNVGGTEWVRGEVIGDKIRKLLRRVQVIYNLVDFYKDFSSYAEMNRKQLQDYEGRCGIIWNYSWSLWFCVENRLFRGKGENGKICSESTGVILMETVETWTTVDAGILLRSGYTLDVF